MRLSRACPRVRRPSRPEPIRVPHRANRCKRPSWRGCATADSGVSVSTICSPARQEHRYPTVQSLAATWAREHGPCGKCLRSEGCAVQASFADRLATKLSVLIELDTVNSALPAPTRSCCAHRAAVPSSAFRLFVSQHCTLVGSIFRFYLVHVMYAVFATKPGAHARVRGASYGIGRRVSSTMHALVGTERTVPPCRCFGTTSCTGARERARAYAFAE